MTESNDPRKVDSERLDDPDTVLEADVVEVPVEIEIVPSSDYPAGADTPLELVDELPADRTCACIARGEWEPTEQCALRPATRCTTGAPVWAAYTSGGPEAAVAAIKDGNR